MTRKIALAIMLCLLIAPLALSQSEDPPKREVAAEFTVLNREDVFGIKSEAGIGGRFTFNLNKNFALETAGYWFPRNCFDCFNNGHITEVVGGLKAGKRYNTWGIFAKARPGVVSYSKGRFNFLSAPQNPAFPFIFEVKPLTNFAADLGGVLEFYPSRRIVTRFDIGDTIVHIRQQSRNDIRFDPATNTYFLLPVILPGRTTHNFQFSASVGFRW